MRALFEDDSMGIEGVGAVQADLIADVVVGG